MKKEIELIISGLVYNQSVVGTYGLVLSELKGSRRFSVLIGEPEAQSIALKLNNKVSPRPLTHDLINNILGAFDAFLEKVLIYDMVSDVFFAELHINKSGQHFIVDARTSDAVALAVRSDCPIYIKSEILEIVGTEVEPSESSVQSEEGEKAIDEQNLDDLSKEELQEMLEQSLAEEQYEYAVLIRDALSKK